MSCKLRSMLVFIFVTSLMLMPTRCSIQQWTQDEDCAHNPFSVGKLRGDNGYQITIEESEEGLLSNKTYTVNIYAKTDENPTTAFYSWSLISTDDLGQPTGTFQVHETDNSVLVHPKCKNKVSSAKWKKQKISSVEWKSVDQLTTNCVYFRASIHTSHSIWFSEDGGLTKKFCKTATTARKVQCCACGIALYSVTFKGLWSKQSHPRDFPPDSLVHWGNIVGAIHNENFTLWRSGQYASEGMKQLALYGLSSAVESDISQRLQNGKDIREMVLMDGRWTTKLTQPVMSNISVSNVHHMISLASMFGPSPDWFSGIDSLTLCNADCTWKTSHIENLRPFDAGVDAGVTYMGNKIPQTPPQRISQITANQPNNPRSPFYNPGNTIPSMAIVNIELIDTFGTQCPNGKMDKTIPTRPIEELEKLHRRIIIKSVPTKPKRKRPYQVKLIDEDQISECAVTPWSEWSDCHNSMSKNDKFKLVQTRTREYKDPAQASNAKCRQILVEERDCDETLTKHTELRCPTDKWSDWSKCSEKCGIGKKYRTRKLLSNDKRCIGKVKLREEMDCTGNDVSCSSGLKLDMFEKKRVCMQPKSVGTCKDFEDRFYLDFESRKCKPFKYGGCGGNENNFKTIDECENVCDILLLGRTSSGVDSRCVTLPWSEWSECSNSCGPGIQTRHRQYKSKPLALGFCGEILHESRPCNGTKCTSSKPLSIEERIEACTSPIEPGPCKESLLRYYYDTITKRCLPFKYGGCFGNANNFATINDCEETCLGIENRSAIYPSECGYYVLTPWSQCKRSPNGQLIQTRRRKLVTGSAKSTAKCRKFAMIKEARKCQTLDKQDFSSCDDKTSVYTVVLSKVEKDQQIVDKVATHYLHAIILTHSSDFSLNKWSNEASVTFENYLLDGFTEPVVDKLQTYKLESKAILDVREFPLQNLMKQKVEILADTMHPFLTIFGMVLVNQSNILLGALDLSLLSLDGKCEWINLNTTINKLDSITQLFQEICSSEDFSTASHIQLPKGQQLTISINKLRDANEADKSALITDDVRCDLTDWTDWSPCSANCGKGIQVRARSYRSIKAATELGCNAILRQSKICYGVKNTCTEDDRCRTTEWSEWSPCSTSCGVGITTRTRSFVDLNSVNECAKHDISLVEERHCKAAIQRCNKSIISEENKQEICQLPLVDGSPCRSDLIRFYYNHSTDECIPFHFGGCHQNANNFETMEQCLKTCKGVGKELCEYGNWSDWSECTGDCNESTRYKSRQLIKGNEHCEATQVQSEKCDSNAACTKKCEEFAWSDWTKCVGPCGQEGVQRREQIPTEGNTKCPILKEFRFCRVDNC